MLALHSWISSLPRIHKRLLILAFDFCLIPVALWAAVALRFSNVFPADQLWETRSLALGLFAAAIPIALATRTHRMKIGSFDTRDVQSLALSSMALALFGATLNAVLDLGAPRSVAVVFGGIHFILSVFGRLGVQALLSWMSTHGQARVNVAIYGAGASGMQLAAALRRSPDHRPVLLIDDNPALHGLIIAGLEVRALSDLAPLVRNGRVAEVLIAIPGMSPARVAKIKRAVAELGIKCRRLPSYTDLINRGDPAAVLSAMASDELLARDLIDMNAKEISNSYAGRIVLVTGAGGSIGSELCRQLLLCRPKGIVLFEQSEFALFSIEKELRDAARAKSIAVHSYLGSVNDAARVSEVLMRTKAEVVLHAAAYKHVPIIEINEIEGVQNNIFGTAVVAEAARAARVERFILISTDKAVRPTNIMGATKRLAEMVVQDIQRRSNSTIFSMVRFGNVLGSSGSVIPVFQEQIMSGGPVTVTHPQVMRYFMTIPEAARLVLLAGTYAEGGDVFVLDMGYPVRIQDLARRMISLAGLTVRDAATPNGDIELRFIGLRPGEKLCEELLIDTASLVPTPHEKIMRAQEDVPTEVEISVMLRDLRNAVSVRNHDAVRATLMTCVVRDHGDGPAENVASDQKVADFTAYAAAATGR